MRHRERPLAIFMEWPPLDHLTYVHEAEDGTLRAWDVTEGNKLAQDGRKPMVFSLAEHAVTLEKIRSLYEGLDEEYARTADLSRPLLAILFAGEELLILDGWHRLARAVLEGIEELPLLLLNEAEADAIQWLELPSGHGLPWK